MTIKAHTVNNRHAQTPPPRTETLHRALTLCGGYQITRSFDAHGVARVSYRQQPAPPALAAAIHTLTEAGLIDWHDVRRCRQLADLSTLGAATLLQWDQQLFTAADDTSGHAA